MYDETLVNILREYDEYILILKCLILAQQTLFLSFCTGQNSLELDPEAAVTALT